jgi:hypothetical protein
MKTKRSVRHGFYAATAASGLLIAVISCAPAATAPATAPAAATTTVATAPAPPAPCTGLCGTVTDAKTKAPIRTFNVRVLEMAGPGADAATVVEKSFDDRSGRFSTDVDATKTFMVVVQSPGYVPATTSGKSGTPLVIALDPALTVEGVVHDSTGAPLSGVQVEYTFPDPMLKSIPQRVTTDAAGKFTMPVRPGDVSLAFTKDGYVEEKGFASVKDTHHFDQVLMKAVDVAGTVVDDTGAPVEGARVRASSGAPKQDIRDTNSDAQGHFTFSALRPLEYKFEATKRLYFPGDVTATVPVNDLTVRVQRGATVRGSVKNASEEEKAYVFVYIGPLMTGINNTGEFGLLGVPAGDLTTYAEFQAEGKVHRSNVKTLKTKNAGESRVVLEFKNSPVLHGTVMSAGKPVNRALITLTPDAAGTPKFTTVTDDQGTFSIIGIPQGTYGVDVRDRPLISSNKLTQGADTKLDIEVKESTRPQPPRPGMPPGAPGTMPPGMPGMPPAPPPGAPVKPQ